MKNRRWNSLAALGLLALAASPARATITYSQTGGTYATLEGQPSASGLTFSSLITFAPGSFVGTTYTDVTTGVVFNGFSSPGNPNNLQVNGTALEQTNSNNGTRIEITLPANTYAVAFTLSAGSFAGVGAGGNDYEVISFPSLFGVISNTPLTTIIIVKQTGLGGALKIDDFKIGTQSGSGSGDVPEPSSVFLLGGGLILLPLLRRLQTRRRLAHLD